MTIKRRFCLRYLFSKINMVILLKMLANFLIYNRKAMTGKVWAYPIYFKCIYLQQPPSRVDDVTSFSHLLYWTPLISSQKITFLSSWDYRIENDQLLLKRGKEIINVWSFLSLFMVVNGEYNGDSLICGWNEYCICRWPQLRFGAQQGTGFYGWIQTNFRYDNLVISISMTLYCLFM